MSLVTHHYKKLAVRSKCVGRVPPKNIKREIIFSIYKLSWLAALGKWEGEIRFDTMYYSVVVLIHLIIRAVIERYEPS